SRWLNKTTREQLGRFFQRNGEWSIIIARPVPVLAEGSVLFAGLSQMDFKTFMIYSSLSNFAISTVYAWIGSYASSMNSFLLAFAAAIVLPVLAKFVIRRR